jgi:hypothetical protein
MEAEPLKLADSVAHLAPVTVDGNAFKMREAEAKRPAVLVSLALVRVLSVRQLPSRSRAGRAIGKGQSRRPRTNRSVKLLREVSSSSRSSHSG